MLTMAVSKMVGAGEHGRQWGEAITMGMFLKPIYARLERKPAQAGFELTLCQYHATALTSFGGSLQDVRNNKIHIFQDT